MENNLNVVNVDVGKSIEAAVMPIMKYSTKLFKSLRITGDQTIPFFYGEDARLETVDGSLYRQILDGTTRIGRGKFGNDIAIMNDDNSVSRKHIAITIDSSRYDSEGYIYTLHVLGTRNNTKLNGVLLSPGDIKIIKHNDDITLGNFTFIFKTDNIPEEKKQKPIFD